MGRNVESLTNPLSRRQTSLMKQALDALLFITGMKPDYHLLTEKPSLYGRGFLLHRQEVIHAFEQSLQSTDFWDPGEMEREVIRFLQDLFPDAKDLSEPSLQRVTIPVLTRSVSELKKLLVIKSVRQMNEEEHLAFERIKEYIRMATQDNLHEGCSQALLYFHSFQAEESKKSLIDRTAKIDLCLEFQGILDQTPRILLIPKGSVVGFSSTGQNHLRF